MSGLLYIVSVSALSAAAFLRAKKLPSLVSCVTEAAVGVALYAVYPPFPTIPLLILCALSGSLCVIFVSKRSPYDLIPAFCMNAAIALTCLAFDGCLASFCNRDAAFWAYQTFYMIHIPAVFLSFPHFSFPPDWREELCGNSPTKTIITISVLSGVLLAVVIAVIAFSENVGGIAVAVALTSLFWAASALIALILAYSEKKEQITSENTFINEMSAFMNVVRAQRHDYNLHVQTVANLIDTGKWEECRNYVGELVRDTNSLNLILPVKDPAVAALVNNYRIICEKRGIPFVIDIRDDLGDIVTNAYETNKIIGNLLQNALDELSCGGDAIMFEVFKRGGFALVRVSNRVSDKKAFADKPEQLFKQGYTTKKNHDGVGLSSIRSLLRQKGGDVDVWLEDDTVHFVASIPIAFSE